MLARIGRSIMSISKRHFYTQPNMIDKNKVISVTIRPSYCWIQYPYIMDIICDQPYKYVYSMFPGVIEYIVPYTTYSIKYKNKDDLINDVYIFADCGNIINKLE